MGGLTPISCLGVAQDGALAAALDLQDDEVEAERVRLEIPTPPELLPTSNDPIQDAYGPGLGFETLLASYSSDRISRMTGTPLWLVERRRAFLGIVYVRMTKVDRYAYLLGKVPNADIAQLCGVSVETVRRVRKRRGL